MDNEIRDKDESNLLIDSAHNSQDSSDAQSKFLYLSSLIAAFGFFTMGYDVGSISGSMIFITEEFSLTFFWHELLVSMAIGPAIFGSFFSGYCNDAIGRKLTFIMAAVVFIAGSLVMACAYSINVLLLGRILTGISFGFTSVSSNIYISEFAPARVRGRLSSFGSAFVSGAIFLATLTSGLFSRDKTNGWRYMLGLGAVPGLVLFVGVLLVPESPRWLISKGRDQEAIKILRKLRGREDVVEEMYEIKRQHKLAKKEGSLFTILLQILQDPHARKALLIACGLMAFAQLCGQNTILYYSATIIKMSGVKKESEAVWLSSAVSFTLFAFTFVAILTVDRFGRRKLLLTSTVGVFLALVLLSVTFYFEASISPLVTEARNSGNSCFAADTCNNCLYNEMCGFCFLQQGTAIKNASCVPLESYSSTTSRYCDPDFELLRSYGCPSSITINVLTVVGLVLYLVCFAPGLGPVPYIVTSEIFPLWARSAGMACALATCFLCNLLLSMSFLDISRLISKAGCFGLFAGFTLLNCIFTYFLLPETKGKRLEHMSKVVLESNYT